MDKRVVQLVMNEDHSLMKDQQIELVKRYKQIQINLVPISGCTFEEMDQRCVELLKMLEIGNDVVFVSPIPYMLLKLTKSSLNNETAGSVYVFVRETRSNAPDTKHWNKPWVLVS